MDSRDRGHASSAKALQSHDLLATRVLSVNTHWQELRDSSRHKSRQKPVSLWSGESPQRYERKFERWLAMRRLSLAAMREDPMSERKYRLQFARTRGVGMSSSASYRALSPHQLSRSRSRSRSQSRSPPSKRHDIAVHSPRSVSRQNGERGYNHDRNSSPDNGRWVGVKQAADRPLLDVVRNHSIAPESSRLYDSWLAQRSRMETRRPPPLRDVLHRPNLEPWSRSPSRLPHYSKNRSAGSPQSSMKSVSSTTHRMASPHCQMLDKTESVSEELLARRVISVEAFRAELYKHRNGRIHEDDLKRPHEPMVRIPIALLHRETIQQYTLKFESWLQKRNISLASLRDDSAKESSMWYAFACTRAESSDAVKVARSVAVVPARSRSHSRSGSPSRYNCQSLEEGRSPLPLYEMKKPLLRDNRVRSERFESYNQRWRSVSPPKEIPQCEDERLLQEYPRWVLLERQTFTLEQYLKVLEQSAKIEHSTDSASSQFESIPVPLVPGETMGLYDRRFWHWLKKYNENKASIKNDPIMERRFRIEFAKRRAKNSSGLVATQKGQDLQPTVNVLKSSRPCLASNRKRSADENAVQASVGSKQLSNKRARPEAEGSICTYGTPQFFAKHTSSTSKLKRDSTLSLASYQMLHRTRSDAATSNYLTPTFNSTATSTSTALMPNVLPVRATTVAKAGSVQVAVSSPTKMTAASTSARPDYHLALSNAHFANSLTSSFQSKSGMKFKEPTTHTMISSLSTISISEDLRSVKNGSNCKTVSPRSQEISHLLLQQTGVPGTTFQKPLLQQPSQSISLAASTKSTAIVKPASDWKHSNSTVVAIDAPKSAWTNMVVASRQTSQSSDHFAVRNIPTKAYSIENDSANGAADALSADDKVTDAKSKETEELEEHDGDFMNPEGCCCSMCMRNWAQTLTDRMNRLETNVENYKLDTTVK